jgi:hypothetical protein
MKKTIALILFIVILSFSLCSCERQQDAHKMLNEFIFTYGAEGIIYSPKISEGYDGYIHDGLIKKIYRFYGVFPENYAIFLNAHPDFSVECGLFICTDADMVDRVEEMCFERIKLLAMGDDRAFVKQSGRVVFYSTMPDRDRAEKIFNEIIR